MSKTQPQFKIGDEIQWTHTAPSGASANFEGTIQGIDEEEECYFVHCPQYGEGVFPCPFDDAKAA